MSTTLVSLDQYLRYPNDFEPDADYVDGEIEPRPMGVYDHANWQRVLMEWFLLNAKQWNIRVLPELRIRITPTRYRIPDVVVFDRSRPIEQILTHPPIAVFEILSPEDRMSRMTIKLADYEAMGIPTIRVIDPTTRAISEFRNGTLTPIPTLIEPLPNTPGTLDWPAIKALLDD
jgi:Uma2 family endonuclease